MNHELFQRTNLWIVAACLLFMSKRADAQNACFETSIPKTLVSQQQPPSLPERLPEVDNFPKYNQVVLEAIHSMPSGGGYQASGSSIRKLEYAVSLNQNQLQIKPEMAEPGFCSGATYLVFLKTLSLLQTQRKVNIPSSILEILPPAGQPDGRGIWGRWNANGPGAARLFYSLGLGPNFTDLSAAQPGDFLKIFWNNHIGTLEHGHLVVFLGKEQRGEKTFVRFWSSNIPKGYGEKIVPLSSIHFMIFSRLMHPEGILKASLLSPTDSYLASLLSHESSVQEVRRLCGIAK